MPAISDADTMLLQLIRSGDRDGWGQLVERFQGRLIAFARQQLGQTADAEDVVQETFIGFLKAVPTYREEASLETLLFQILRRRIVDSFRSKGRSKFVSLVNSHAGNSGAASQQQAVDRFQSQDQTGSSYVRREEQDAADLQALIFAVGQVVEQFKTAQRWRELQIFDLLFFAQWKNQAIAQTLGEDEAAIAVIKHRFLKRVAARIEPSDSDSNPQGGDPVSSDLLERVWEDARPSCLKRTTLGKYLLGTLAEDWDNYTTFHLETLGCHFCQANFADLEAATAESDDQQRRQLQNRIMQSTVGFFQLSDG
jgi:RNA polymerase sigma factor (sigma-70 family)